MGLHRVAKSKETLKTARKRKLASPDSWTSPRLDAAWRVEDMNFEVSAITTILA